jgi:hypothetical protein
VRAPSLFTTAVRALRPTGREWMGEERSRLAPRRVGLIFCHHASPGWAPVWPQSAGRPGASVFKMRDVSRHKSMDVLQAYVRDADLFRDHAGAGLL